MISAPKRRSARAKPNIAKKMAGEEPAEHSASNPAGSVRDSASGVGTPLSERKKNIESTPHFAGAIQPVPHL